MGTVRLDLGAGTLVCPPYIFPEGMTITYALIQMVEKVAEKSDKARIITKAEVKKLLTNSAGACVGC
eukprot:1375998-Amphidinium_carterae.1